MQKKVKFHCYRCDLTWEAIPYNILNPRPEKKSKDVCCPRCVRRIPQTTTEEFIEELREVHPNISLIGKFTGVDKKLRFRCLNHTVPFEWSAFAGNILRGVGCPKCANATARSSFPEKAIFYYLLRDLDEPIIYHPRVATLSGDVTFEADIFLPARKLFIEYDGVYWYSQPGVSERYQKREEAIYENGCSCLHIAEVDKRKGREKSAVEAWMVEPPLCIDACEASTLYKRIGLDNCLVELEKRLRITPKGEFSSFCDKAKIEESIENEYTFCCILIGGDEIQFIDE